MKQNDNADIKKLSFEDAMKELEMIINKLQSGQQSLDNAIEDFTRGTILKDHCEKKLTEAKLKIEKIIAKEDGTIKTEPFESN